MTDRIRRRRSALYMPASNARAIEKSRGIPCDVVILDLEDAVAPDQKITAREQAVATVYEGGFGDRELVVRVNGLDTPWGRDDIEAVCAARPDALLVPKIDDAKAVRDHAALMSGSDVPLWAMVETTRAVFRLDEIAEALAAIGPGCFVMGTNDLAKEMFARPGTDRAPFLSIMTMAVVAARAHGLGILDGVFNGLEDEDGLRIQLAQAIEFGFDGKTLIHPKQVAPTNEMLTPDAEEVDWSRKIIAAFDQPENSAKGAIRVEGKMVERLHLEQAKRAIALAGG